MTILSAPRNSGYQKGFETIQEARDAAAGLLGCSLDEMIESDSPDGGTTYCYASQDEADSDRDGAYAVQYSEQV